MKPIVAGILGIIVGAGAGVGGIYGAGHFGSGAMDREAVESVVRDFITEHPDLIIESVQNWQEGKTEKQSADVAETLKKNQKELFNAKYDGSFGPKDADVTIVEFFDYNCPACRMMFKSLDGLLAKDKKVRVVFKEMPIFGRESNENSKIGMAVALVAPEKYYAFHEAMMAQEGRITPEKTMEIAVGLGIEKTKITALTEGDGLLPNIAANHQLAGKLNINGTPGLVINNKVIPSALPLEELVRVVKEVREGTSEE